MLHIYILYVYLYYISISYIYIYNIYIYISNWSNGVRPPISGRVESVKRSQPRVSGSDRPRMVATGNSQNVYWKSRRTPLPPGKIGRTSGGVAEFCSSGISVELAGGVNTGVWTATKSEFYCRRYYKGTQNRAVWLKEKGVRYKKTNYQ
jgi:hypothetical protein